MIGRWIALGQQCIRAPERALLCCRIYCYLMNCVPLLFKVGDGANCPSCTLWPPCTQISWSPTTISSLFLPVQVLNVTSCSVLVQKGQSPKIVSNQARAPDCLPASSHTLGTLVFLLAVLFSGPWSCSPAAFAGQNTHFLILASLFPPTLLFSVSGFTLFLCMTAHEWWWGREDQDGFLICSLVFPSTFCHRYYWGFFFSFFPHKTPFQVEKDPYCPYQKNSHSDTLNAGSASPSTLSFFSFISKQTTSVRC